VSGAADVARREGAPPLAVGADVQLREPTEADAAELHALIVGNRGRLARWLRWAAEQTPHDTLEFVRRARARAADGTGLELALVAGGRIIGMAGFPVIDSGAGRGEIGYWIDGAHERRGLMTAAVAALLEHGFEHLRLRRIEIRIDVRNVRSRALAERLGFRHEATLQTASWMGDRYSDDAIYALHARERAHAGARLDGNG
jgi:ribosomal-protein-serine acetyltransferase